MKHGKIYRESLKAVDTKVAYETKEAIEKRYNERYSIYLSSCDERIDADCEARAVCERILSDFSK